MNKIDKDFRNLIKTINTFTEEEIIERLKEKYRKVPEYTRSSIETFFKQFNYWGTLNPLENNYEEIENKAHNLKIEINNFKELYKELEDYRSKKTLFAILNNWFNYDFFTLESVIEKTFPHYLDLDLVPFLKDECLVDLGSYIGDTILDFTNMYGPEAFKKIYAYEMSKDSVLKLKENTINLENVIVRQKAVSDEVGFGKIVENKESSANVLEKENEGNIEITTLDKDIKEKITLIKMDIEGSEEKAIIGAKEHIKNTTPKLFISVYHRFEDLTKIYRQIKEINPNYKFYLRYYGGAIFPTEIVLIALPKKREFPVLKETFFS